MLLVVLVASLVVPLSQYSYAHLSDNIQSKGSINSLESTLSNIASSKINNSVQPDNTNNPNSNSQLVDPLESRSAAISDADKERLATLSLPFIQNMGQLNPQVRYYANTFAGTVFVTNEGLTYSIPDPSNERSSAKESRTYSVIQEDFAGKELKISGVQKSSAGVSYFIGNSKKDWYTDIPTYDTLSLGTLYPGINLDLKAHGKNVEKVFTISPSGDVKDIKVGVSGVQKLKVDDDGKLLLYTEKGTISMTKPLAYQEIQGIKKTVDVSYTVSDRSYGFELGSYDTTLPVVIDPIIQSTYLGGSDYDQGFDIALYSSGNVYVTGLIISTN